ncbi:MAG: hypothetical protein RBR84_11035, partial [Bacteroidales bacterium]|nr:hypothetical protein [Bacteroidales bacterium]
KGIFYNGGLVGINIGADMPRYQLHVNGSVGVRSLEIIGQYSLPDKAGKEDEYLNGFGEWTPIEAGDSFWQGGTGTGIYFNRGAVGIGTTGANANASLQVVGNMNVGNNPHTGSIIGENAFVGGEESEASGLNSFAYGDRAKAANTGAFAVGLRAEANGRYSAAIGRASMANHDNAIALGYATEASATNAIVIGKHARASVSNAYIIGSGVGLSSSMLVNEVDHSLIIGFESTVPTFFVGPSDGIGTTGRIGIGNMTDPQAKLHIYSDEDEAATLKLEHRTTGKDRYAEIGIGTHSIRAGNTENMVFKTPSSRHFVFENGNVGIGVASPKAKLEVNGDILFTGQLFTDEGPYQPSPWEINGEELYYLKGNVGIGIDQPTTSLGVSGTISVGYHVPVPNDQNNVLVEGKVGIGTFAPEAPLDVAGKIRSESLQLTQGFYPGYLLTSDDQGHAIWTNPETILNIGPWQRQGNNVFVTGYDRVGIGTDQPTESLQINGNMMLSNNGNIKGNRTSWQPFKIFAGNDESEPYIALYGNSQNTGSIKLYSFGTGGQIEFHNENMKVMSIRADNNVYFGNPDYSTHLFVNGEITANQVRVNTSFWWDKVLKPDYELMPLAELQTFITHNSHLPDIPKETEVLEQGVDLGEMNGLLLKKIEELTLYLLEQDRKINTLQVEMQQLKQANLKY